jgi:hypothetical protein
MANQLGPLIDLDAIRVAFDGPMVPLTASMHGSLRSTVDLDPFGCVLSGIALMRNL